MKKIIVIYLFILINYSLFGQNECSLPVVHYQSQIDNFLINNPDCTKLLGNLKIQAIDNSDVINLEPLSQIEEVVGGLSVLATDLTTLHGLHNIKSVEYLDIRSNNNLINFTGLEGLDSISLYADLRFNSNLQNIEGLNNLDYVGTWMGLSSSNSLISLSGLEELDSIQALDISFNPNLENLGNFADLESLNSLHIIDNPQLESFVGLEKLENVFTPIHFFIIS